MESTNGLTDTVFTIEVKEEDPAIAEVRQRASKALEQRLTPLTPHLIQLVADIFGNIAAVARNPENVPATAKCIALVEEGATLLITVSKFPEWDAIFSAETMAQAQAMIGEIVIPTDITPADLMEETREIALRYRGPIARIADGLSDLILVLKDDLPIVMA